MKFDVKKIVSLALAGCFAFGAVAAVVPGIASVAFAAEEYADGTSNTYSHRMKEEQKRHESAVRAIRYEYRQDGDEKKYRKRMKEEQEKHDKAMEHIRHDYDNHARHSHR